jgi:hypothetical protein
MSPLLGSANIAALKVALGMRIERLLAAYEASIVGPYFEENIWDMYLIEIY